MLKTYRKCVQYVLDGKSISFAGENSGWIILDESQVVESKNEWHGLEEIEKAVTNKDSPVFYRKTLFKKKLCLVEWDGKSVQVNENSILTKIISYKQIDASLEELFKLRDSNKVIEYLKERGITICPMKA